MERKDASSVIAAKVEPRQVEGEAVGVRPPEADATRCLYCDGSPALLFTENETNKERLFGVPSATPFVKDGIDSFVVHGRTDAVNPQQIGTKAGAHYVVTVDPPFPLQNSAIFTPYCRKLLFKGPGACPS
ncbi:hypothetical protein AJ87_35435 [Rhizobium yanglingense]|nr:hypothetical protein AJ87_35435 [Rhizobium yanglingense]